MYREGEKYIDRDRERERESRAIDNARNGKRDGERQFGEKGGGGESSLSLIGVRRDRG